MYPLPKWMVFDKNFIVNAKAIAYEILQGYSYQ